MERPQISVFIASSLDGYIAGPDDDLSWLEEVAGSATDYGFHDFLAGTDAVAMGMGTWRVIADIPTLPYGGRPIYVFTSGEATPREGVTFFAGSVQEAIEEWTRAGLRRVYVDGGRLISAFLAEGLVDDLTITVVPILIGGGAPLFHPVFDRTRLQLVQQRHWPTGVVQLTYSTG